MAQISPDYKNPLTGTGDAKSSNAIKERKHTTSLDKDAFLKLLITQMQYQDPLNPIEDKEFMGQMAQFSALEQMQNVAKSAEISRAYALIGKTVDATYYNEASGENENIKGIVQFVTQKNGKTFITVNKKLIEVDRVENVYDDLMNNVISGGINQQQAIGLIGKTVQAIYIKEDGSKEFIEGKVDYVKSTGDNIVLMVDNKEIFLSEVLIVSEKKLLLGQEVTINYEGKEIKGKVDKVILEDDKAFVVVKDKKVEVKFVNDVTEALGFLGKEVNFGEKEGFHKVEDIYIEDGKVSLVSGKHKIEISQLRKQLSGSNEEDKKKK